jgi:hypothetical protein
MEDIVQVAFGSATLFRVAVNWWLPPAGTVVVLGVMASPVPAPTVTTAVLDVMVSGVVLVLVPS